jgi:F-type H+-transporting ATPase subunit delta
MAELSTLARPYAKAAFEYADAENALDSGSPICSWSPPWCRWPCRPAGDPALTTEAQAEHLSACSAMKSATAASALRVLAENRRLNLAPEILAQFAQFKAQRESRRRCRDGIGASRSRTQCASAFAKALGEAPAARGRGQHRVDSSLLGGVLIRAGDLVIDGSVRGRLNKLAEALTN